MYTTPDAWGRPKRTINKRHFNWSKRQRQQHFEDIVFSLCDRIHSEDKELRFDDMLPVQAMLSGWAGETVTEFLDWAKGKNERHIRTALKLFLKYGDSIFNCATSPVVPAMPEWHAFMEKKPFSKTRQ